MAKPLRLLHVIGAAKPGGAETFAVRLITALHNKKDVEIAVVARKGWAATRLKAQGVRVMEAPFGGWWDNALAVFGWGTAGKVKRAAEAFGPDIIQSWMNRASQFVPQGKWKTVGRLGGFYNLKYYFNKVNYLIGNTKEICNYCVKEGWPKTRVQHIANFVPVPDKGWEKAGEGLREELKIPANAYVMVAVGRLHPVKGLDVALAALVGVPESYLVLVGEGPLRHELELLAQKLGVAKRVRFVGWADDIAPYAAIADVWLAPSRHEPLGNTVLDSWAHGVPTIASAIGGLKTLVKDGVTGLSVPVNDARALTAAIIKLKKSKVLGAKLARGARMRLQKEFSEVVVVQRYLDYYRGLLKVKS